MDSIKQNLLPSPHSTILIHHYNGSKVAELSQKLFDAQATVLGVAVKLSRTGDLEYIALAASNQVYLLKVDNKDASKHTRLRSVLNGSRFLLAGFDMAALALLIHRGVEQRLRGIDLSTLFATSSQKPWSPSKLMAEIVSPAVRRADVDQLWNGDSQRGSHEVCLRAWLSARFEIPTFLTQYLLLTFANDSAAECIRSNADHAFKMENALQVDTDHLGPEVSIEIISFHKTYIPIPQGTESIWKDGPGNYITQKRTTE